MSKHPTKNFLRFYSLLLLIVLPLCPVQAQSVSLNEMPNWILKTQDGSTLEYGSLKDKPMVLHFWATWCPYCKKLQPGLEDLRIKYEAKGLQVYGVSFYEDEGAKPQDALEERGLGMITAVNGDALARKLGVTGTPTTFFVFAGGKIMTKTHTSNPRDPLLEKAALALLEMD